MADPLVLRCCNGQADLGDAAGSAERELSRHVEQAAVDVSRAIELLLARKQRRQQEQQQATGSRGPGMRGAGGVFAGKAGAAAEWQEEKEAAEVSGLWTSRT